MEQGFQHKGFAMIEVLSPCVTHNKMNTYEWFKNHTFRIEDEDGYEPFNREKAWEVLGRKEKFALGLIYRQKKPSFDDLLVTGKRPLAQSPLEFDLKKMKTILKKFE
jgi:2-oxoglutarate ferredoxin oxidoreductase subunit beta